MEKGREEMVVSVVMRTVMRTVGTVVRAGMSTRAVRVMAVRTGIDVRVHLKVRSDVAWQLVRRLATTTATEGVRHTRLEVGDFVFNNRLPPAESSRKHATLLGWLARCEFGT